MTIIYCRKSTESEDRQVLSIDSQIQELSSLAEREGLKIDKLFTESKSAKSVGRPEFEKMVKLIEENNNTTLLCWKLDRLSRNPIDTGRITSLLQLGKIKEIKTFEKSYFPTDNVLLMYVELGMANQFLRDLSQNVKRGIRQKLAKGEWIGNAPVGYLNDKLNHTIYPDPEKSKYIHKAFELFSTGAYSVKDIANILYKDGFRTRGSNKVHGSAVYRILNNPFYAGTMLVKGVLYPASHTPLVSQTLFDSCQRIFSPNRSRKQKHHFPLRGYMDCAECGCALTATTKKGYTYYYCTNGKKSCTQHKTYLRSELAERLIGEVFSNIRLDNEIIEIMYLAAKERISQNTEYNQNAHDTVNKQIETTLQRQNRLLDMFLAGDLDKETYSGKKVELQNEITTLENQRKSIKVQDPYATLEQTKKAFLTAYNAEKDFLSADDDKKSELVKILLWNASIKDRKVQRFQLKQPFQLMAEAPKTDDIFLWHGL